MAKNQIERPLSPHLQIYRPMLTMTMSILHRITGMMLSLGLFMVIGWLVAAASGGNTYIYAQECLTSWFGLLLLLGFTFALMHHLLGGIRHLIWDTGKGFDLKTVEVMAWANIIGSICLTLLIWIIGYGVFT